MLGLSLTSTVAQRDATIATLSATLAVANAMLDAMRESRDGWQSLAGQFGDDGRALVAKLADFADRSIPPKVSGEKVTQPKSTLDADATAAKRLREKEKRT